MITKTIAISTKIVKPCSETGHPVLSLKKGQWKLAEPHDQKFAVEGKLLIIEAIN